MPHPLCVFEEKRRINLINTNIIIEENTVSTTEHSVHYRVGAWTDRRTGGTVEEDALGRRHAELFKLLRVFDGVLHELAQLPLDVLVRPPMSS